MINCLFHPISSWSNNTVCSEVQTPTKSCYLESYGSELMDEQLHQMVRGTWPESSPKTSPCRSRASLSAAKISSFASDKESALDFRVTDFDSPLNCRWKWNLDFFADIWMNLGIFRIWREWFMDDRDFLGVKWCFMTSWTLVLFGNRKTWGETIVEEL